MQTNSRRPTARFQFLSPNSELLVPNFVSYSLSPNSELMTPNFISYSLERGHSQKTQCPRHHLLKGLNQSQPKGSESFVLKVNKRGLDLRTRVRTLIEVGKGGCQGKGIFCQL